jgi:hypothetical protein
MILSIQEKERLPIMLRLICQVLEGKGYLKQERFVSSYMRMIALPQDENTEKFENYYT